jgi:hypothetical protein
LLRKQAKQRILTLHRNAQRLLRPYAVVNPYADRLTFIDDKTRTRRDHEKYLTLIDVITLLHQHQRAIRTTTCCGRAIDYIEATLDDIDAANRLAHEVLGTSAHELPPQTRRVLSAVHAIIAADMAAQGLPQREIRFTRAQVRAATGLSDTQATIHMERLIAMEYVLIHRGRRGQSYEYELLHDGTTDCGAHLSGLIDVDALKIPPTTASSRGQEPRFTGSSRPHSAPISAPSRTAQPAAAPQPGADCAESAAAMPESRATPTRAVQPSYPQPLPLAAAGA